MNTLQRLAKEIVAAKPDLIFSSGSPTTRFLKQETTTIPIVFGNLVDPVGQGFVASLARPGGPCASVNCCQYGISEPLLRDESLLSQ